MELGGDTSNTTTCRVPYARYGHCCRRHTFVEVAQDGDHLIGEVERHGGGGQVERTHHRGHNTAAMQGQERAEAGQHTRK